MQAYCIQQPVVVSCKSWEFSGKLIINWLQVATVGCPIINIKRKIHIHKLCAFFDICTQICNRSMRSRPTDCGVIIIIALQKFGLTTFFSPIIQSSQEQFYFDLEWGNRIKYCTNWRNFYRVKFVLLNESIFGGTISDSWWQVPYSLKC